LTGKSCFFIGHRETPGKVYPGLVGVVERHIEELGVTDFIVGHYGAFDRLAAKAVLEAKARHPEITLFLLLPYHPTERPIIARKGFDGTYYPTGMENVPRRFAIIRANRYMIDSSDYLIAYVRNTIGSAAKILSYAEKQARNRSLGITNLAVPPYAGDS